MSTSLKLQPGSRVAVIGGGPAGSFFALYLFHYARSQGLDLEVDIYEPRGFAAAGPKGCNRCAGILSASLVQNLKELALELPSTVIQNTITAYSLHSAYGTVEVHNPEPQNPIYSVYRGGGPLRFPLGPEASFDRFLLERATASGARVIAERVTEICGGPQPTVACQDEKRPYRLVVLACGVNTLGIHLVGLNYLPPRLRRMAQDELYARPEDIREAFGSSVRVCLFPHSDLVFASLTPKNAFLNVSLLSRGHAPPSVEAFLNHEMVQRLLPFPYQRACGCNPLIAVEAARKPAADGFVAIGDACVTRLYKDGIGSALLTARQAARTAVFHGIGYGDFRRNYLPFCHAVERDNGWGKILFRLHVRTKDSRAFFLAHGRLAKKEMEASGQPAADPGERPFNQIIWGLFTGSYSYGHILRLSLSPRVVLKLAGAVVREIREKAGKEAEAKRDINIVILGGGFGGMYALRHLKRALRQEKNIQVTLVSRENFFLFTPFLHEVATGGIETRHIAYPIRQMGGWPRFRFIHGEVTSVDLAQKKIYWENGIVVYDYLVLALGSVTDTHQLPASTENVFTLKTLRDGMLLRNHIIRQFEAADAEPSPERQRRLLTFVVVGGGSTGVQLVTEMRDFIHRFLLKNYPRVHPPLIRIMLVQDKDYVLEGMDAKLGDYALDCLRHKGIEVRLKSQVTGITAESVQLTEEGETPTHTVVWVAGVRANPVVASLPLPQDQIGRVVVNERLEVPGFPGVYALGDNAHFRDRGRGRALLPRAHIAARQARVVVNNILAGIRGRTPHRYRYSHMGEMVSLGSHAAAINIYGFRLYGPAARLIWLMSYLALLIGRYNRIRVMGDWFLGLVFGRDSTLLNIR